MEMVWICLVALTYLGLIGAFLMYRKIKNLEDCIDRDLELYNTRINKLDDHLYELKQKVDKVPKVETKSIPCTEWKPTSGRYPWGQNVDERFKRVWDAIDAMKEGVDAMKEDVDADWSELHDDTDRHEDLINLISMKVDGSCERLDKLESELHDDIYRHEAVINSIGEVVKGIHDRQDALINHLDDELQAIKTGKESSNASE